MTYQEAAQNLINLYANYVDVCVSNDQGWEDYSEEIVVAVEALLIRADQEKTRAMEQNPISHLSAVTPTPTIQPSIQEWLDCGKNLADYAMEYGIK